MRKTVESLGERYQLFSEWRDAGNCTLTDGDLYLLRKKEVCSYLSVLVASGLIVVVVKLSLAVTDTSMNITLPICTRVFWLYVITCYMLFLICVLVPVSHLKARLTRQCHNRVYVLKDSCIIVNGEVCRVAYNTSEDKVVVTDSNNNQYVFGYKVIDDGRFKIHWGELIVELSERALTNLDKV